MKKKKAPWHKSSPDLLSTIRAYLAERYPTLHVHVVCNVVVVRGSFPLEHDGNQLDCYQIQILFPEDYPEGIPKVFEIGGRIPHHIDWHVFPSSGAACLFIAEDRLTAWPRGSSFKEFLETPVRNYYLSQIHFARTGRWPTGWEPRSHGEEGIFEAYRDILGTRDDQVILRYMWVMSHDLVKGHWPCPCGGKNIRTCHREQIRDLQIRIPPELVRLRFEQIPSLRHRALRAMFGSE